MIYMPIIDYTKKGAQELGDGYLASGIVPVAYEVVWPEYTPEVQATLKRILGVGSQTVVNALWPRHNAGCVTTPPSRVIPPKSTVSCSRPAPRWCSPTGLRC